VGLVTYSESAADSNDPALPVQSVKAALLKAGYNETRELCEPGGTLVETFELRRPGRPHYHITCGIDLTSRDGHVVGFAHFAPLTETPD
jgi:hypothetical protein